MDDSVKQYLMLGREYYANQDWERAEQMLRLVLEREDRYADVHNMLGVIAHSRGNFIAAEKHLERATEINPGYTEAALNLAVTYNDRGKYDRAKELYAQIRASQPAPNGFIGVDPFVRGRLANMHAELGQAYADAGLHPEAIIELEKAVSLCPQFADLRTKLGNLLRETGDLARAKTHYESAISTRPEYIPALIQLGVTELALGDAAQAEATWNRVLTVDASNAQAKMYLRVMRQRTSQAPKK